MKRYTMTDKGLVAKPALLVPNDLQTSVLRLANTERSFTVETRRRSGKSTIPFLLAQKYPNRLVIMVTKNSVQAKPLEDAREKLDLDNMVVQSLSEFLNTQWSIKIHYLVFDEFNADQIAEINTRSAEHVIGLYTATP